jgi:major type 1 subunit fimbrin (pilin)
MRWEIRHRLFANSEDNMNNWFKRAAAAAGIAAALAAPMSGLASDGTITFTGAVTGSSCTINVNGTNAADATVALPTVDTAALTDVAPRSTAGGTFFYMTLSGCTGLDDYGLGAAPTNVQIYFEAGPNVDENTGGLINTIGPGGSNAGGSNVEVMLYNASEASIVGSQITPGKATVQPPVQTIAGAGQQWFYAGYSTARNGAASAGAVTTSVTYSLIYN